jgi:hypothetical protein
MKRHVQQIIDEGFDFDLIDPHYFFSDGVASAMLGRRLGGPVIITARDSYVTLIKRIRSSTAGDDLGWKSCGRRYHHLQGAEK